MWPALRLRFGWRAKPDFEPFLNDGMGPFKWRCDAFRGFQSRIRCPKFNKRRAHLASRISNIEFTSQRLSAHGLPSLSPCFITQHDMTRGIFHPICFPSMRAEYPVALSGVF